MLKYIVIFILLSTVTLACDIEVKEEHQVNTKLTYKIQAEPPITYWITKDNQTIKPPRNTTSLSQKGYTPKELGTITLHAKTNNCKVKKQVKITSKKETTPKTNYNPSTKNNINKQPRTIYLSSSEKSTEYIIYGLIAALILTLANGIHNKINNRNDGIPRRTYPKSNEQYSRKAWSKQKTRNYKKRYSTYRKSKRKDVLNFRRTRDQIQRY